MSNPLDLLDQITSGGYTSRKLDAYMQMRERVARQIGEQSAPIMTAPQLREQLLLALKKELARSYRGASSTGKLTPMVALFYGRSVHDMLSMTSSEMAELVNSHPGTDFGIKDLDNLGVLFASVMRKNVAVIGNLLMYEAKTIPGPLVEFIREMGGTVTDEMIARAMI